MNELGIVNPFIKSEKSNLESQILERALSAKLIKVEANKVKVTIDGDSKECFDWVELIRFIFSNNNFYISVEASYSLKIKIFYQGLSKLYYANSRKISDREDGIQLLPFITSSKAEILTALNTIARDIIELINQAEKIVNDFNEENNQ
jgi:hypothetical protein